MAPDFFLTDLRDLARAASGLRRFCSNRFFLFSGRDESTTLQVAHL